MEMKVGLTYVCMNLKKLAKILAKKEQKTYDIVHSLINVTKNFIYAEKWCWSQTPAPTLSTACGHFNPARKYRQKKAVRGC